MDLQLTEDHKLDDQPALTDKLMVLLITTSRSHFNYQFTTNCYTAFAENGK